MTSESKAVCVSAMAAALDKTRSWEIRFVPVDMVRFMVMVNQKKGKPWKIKSQTCGVVIIVITMFLFNQEIEGTGIGHPGVAK